MWISYKGENIILAPLLLFIICWVCFTGFLRRTNLFTQLINNCCKKQGASWNAIAMTLLKV